MPRVKYYNTDTNKWEYADKSYGSNKNVDLAGYVKSVNGETPDENGNVEVQIGATEEEVAQIAELAAELVDVPTDEHINDLINSALGVIENGTY